MVSVIRSWRILLALLSIQSAIALLPLNASRGADAAPSRSIHRYADEVAKLAAAPAPAPGGVLMVGSSIFRKWLTCARDLAPLPVTNKAFGGSVTSDQLFFFNQIVPSSRATLVVWYCGSNDINANGTPDFILKNTKEWIGRTHEAIPQARIVLVSVIRAPQKREAGLLPQVNAVNEGYIRIAGSDPDVVYVDVNPAMESPAGAAVAECYVQDKLHLTPEGYTRMTSVLLPVIRKEWKASTELHPSP